MATSAAARQLRPYQIIAAACVGNALEWYDIAVYSFFASYVAQVFFPTADPASSLLLALGTFAASFLIRPVGAIVLGSYADRVGRKPALSLSIGLMVVGTLLITVMPSYETIGIIAPIGILVARLIQGFSAGGEFGSATALMVEHLPHRRGYAASWQFTSQSISTLLAAALGTYLTSTLSDEQLLSWGFRIPRSPWASWSGRSATTSGGTFPRLRSSSTPPPAATAGHRGARYCANRRAAYCSRSAFSP